MGVGGWVDGWVWVDRYSVVGEWGTVAGEEEEEEEEWSSEEEEDEEMEGEKEEEDEEWLYEQWAAARFKARMGTSYTDFVVWRGRDDRRQDIEVARREREDAGRGRIPIPKGNKDRYRY